MKIAMLGAGGIGCYYAARLAAAGNTVVFVARGEHLQAMQTHGLEIVHPDFHFHSPVTATDIAGLCREHSCDSFDLIMLAAKGGATSPMLTEMQHWLSQSDTPLLSIQNGVGNESIIEQFIGRERTIGGLGTRISGHIVAPGKIAATGLGEIDFGAWPTAAANPTLNAFVTRLADVFSAAGITNELYADMRLALWRKLAINNSVNPLTALTFLDTGVVTTDPIFRHTVHQIMEETCRAANAAGVNMTAKDTEEMFTLICEFGSIKTSMQVDRERGRTMEIEEICGPVIEHCRKVGKPAYTTELIYRLLKNAVADTH